MIVLDAGAECSWYRPSELYGTHVAVEVDEGIRGGRKVWIQTCSSMPPSWPARDDAPASEVKVGDVVWWRSTDGAHGYRHGKVTEVGNMYARIDSAIGVKLTELHRFV